MLHELNERCGDCLVVHLLWNDVDGDVVLAVQDGPRVFADVSIPPAEATEAFDHPFLYLGEPMESTVEPTPEREWNLDDGGEGVTA